MLTRSPLGEGRSSAGQRVGGPWGAGCCGLGVLHAQGMPRARGCCGARWVRHNGAAIPPLPGRVRWRVAVVAGLGTRWWGAEGAGGGFVMSGVEGGAGRRANLALALPAPRGTGGSHRGRCRGRGARPKAARGLARQEEGWRGEQRCHRHRRDRTKAPMQEGAVGVGRGRAVPPVATSPGPWRRGGYRVPLCWLASGGAHRASRGRGGIYF